MIFSSIISNQVTHCYEMPELDITSDYETLLICLEAKEMEAKKSANIKFQLEKIDKKQFCSSLEG